MKQQILSLFLSLCIANVLVAQEIPPVELSQALLSKAIKINLKGLGGYQGECLGISVKNVSAKPICVKIPAGWTFVSDDSTVQDLIIVKEELITLKGGETKNEKLSTMCTQSYNHGPAKDEKFSLGKLAEDNLLKVAQYLSSMKKASSTGQCAVWAVANGNPISEVYGEDTAEVKGLANLLSGILNVPVSSFIFTPKPHYLTNINTSFEWRTDEPLQKASLRLYDSTGTVIRTYFQDKDFEEGFHQKKFGLFHTQHPSSRFILSLEAGGKVIAQRVVNKEDSTTNLKRYDSNVLMRFKSLATQNCRVAVYDEEGDLYFPVFKDKKYETANYNTTVAVGVDLPTEKKYYVRIVNEEGKLVAEQKLEGKAQTEVFPPEKINIVWDYELTETIRGGKICAINEAGEEVKIYAENAILHPGKKNYACTFTHTSGPKAHFKLVIKDAEGNIVKERMIK